MKLNISKEQAIKILGQRILELDSFNFIPKAWKDRTILDCKEIFGELSNQWIQVYGINFDTYVTAEKTKVLNEGKQTAKNLLNSYIDFIHEYSKVIEEKQLIKEQNYEDKYFSLLKQWNELVPDYNDIIKKYEGKLGETEKHLDEIVNRNDEIERLKQNTIQLDNVSFKKLWTALFNLPAGQLIGVFSTLLGLLIGAFTLGTLFERTSANNELFDLRNSQKLIQEQNEKIKFSYDSLKRATTFKIDTTANYKTK